MRIHVNIIETTGLTVVIFLTSPPRSARIMMSYEYITSRVGSIKVARNISLFDTLHILFK
jgi:hypothetical protein